MSIRFSDRVLQAAMWTAITVFASHAAIGQAGAAPPLQQQSASGAAAEQNLQAGFDAADSGDYAKALNVWLSLAQSGNAEAQVLLGIMYAKGRGIPQDDERAVGWLRKAAEQGHAQGQLLLGVHYKAGRGVPQDDKQAATWWRKAAEQGDAMARDYLGHMYKDHHRAPQDY